MIRAEVKAYVQAGIAPATKRAYRADLDHFEAWGGTIPATDTLVATYIADHAALLKVSTLTRRLAAVSIAHDTRDLPNPVRTALVRATMRGIRREHGVAQRQASRFSARTSSSFLPPWATGARTCGTKRS